MEARSVSNRSIVRDDLDDSNYEAWSSCMEDYLVSQDLWDVVVEDEPDTETAQETGKSSSDSSKIWRKRNASALHAIKISCSSKFLALVVKIKSAKEAWILLAATAAGSAATEEMSIVNKHEELQAATRNRALPDHLVHPGYTNQSFKTQLVSRENGAVPSSYNKVPSKTQPVFSSYNKRPASKTRPSPRIPNSNK